MPGLKGLLCSNNNLTELDLSTVPGLTGLRCYGNNLSKLDLSMVPELTDLWCESNNLTEHGPQSSVQHGVVDSCIGPGAELPMGLPVQAQQLAGADDRLATTLGQ